jgi:hypothetical protein
METAILKSAEILKSIKPLEEEEVDSDMNKNLYAHIKYLLKTKYAMNDNEKFDDLFEDISLRLKAYGYYLKDDDDLSSDYIQKLLKEPQIIENILNEYNKEKLLLKPPAKVEEGAEPQPITSINFIPDYYELFQKFGSIGINFSKKELLLLNKSLTKLATILTTGNITFFGKFFGTEKDYYIVEATEIDPPENFNYDNDMEKRKEDGINKNVFYATNDLSEKWIELPDVKPSQIKSSRLIKYTLTGNLENPIYSNPTFIGTEKHYLRCLIARIYHGAKLAPSINHFTIEDQESPFKPLTPAEKPKKLNYNDLIKSENWIHFPPGILNCGRVSHMTEDPPEGVDPEEFKKQVIAKDPFDKRMQKISEDRKIFINQRIRINPWRIETGYEDNIYINPYIKMLDETAPDFDPNEQKDNMANFLAISIKSLRWPGAVNIWTGKETYFFYFGNGQKYVEVNDKPYVFKDFPKIPEDKKDKVDQPEPHIIKSEEPKKEEGK